jgi:suppressor for copper-sensitivity B
MTRRRLPTAFLLLFLLGAAIPRGPSVAAATDWIGDAHAAARLITAVEAAGSSTELDAGLQIRLAPGWHAYWRTPGDAGLAPSIDWKGSKNLAGVMIAWPAPHRFSLNGLETQGYENGVVLPIAVTLANPGEAVLLHAVVDYAACKDVCVPYQASLVATLPPGLAVPGPEATLIAAARGKVPGDPASARLRLVGAVIETAKDAAILSVQVASTGAPLRAPDLFVEGVPKGSPGRPEIALADAGRVATLRVPIRGESAAALAGTRLRLTLVDGERSAETEVTPPLGALPPLAGERVTVAIIGLALLGGLVLNLMPCVLPVLSLKLLAFLGYAGAERRQGRLGLLATATGVIVSFGVLAATLILLKAAGAAIGWGIQFQQPWFLAGMALVTTLFAASLWGWVPIALPGGIAGAVGSVRGGGRLADAFLMGAFATLLAASCSAPFVGTAIGFALSRGPLDIVLVFAALGLGMASPFLAVAAWPRLVTWLPRPGPWMDWLRRVLGLALLSTAVWLLSVLAREAGLWSALAAGVTLLALLLLVAARAVLRFDRYAGRAIGVAAIVLSAAAVLVPSLRGQAVPIGVPDEIAQTDLWRRYDAAALQGPVAGGQVVLVDVSAAWCLICKVNELTVLERAPVADKLREPGVVAMRADWTRPDPSITAYLQSFGRYGVPLDVVYGPGAPAGIALPELVTAGVVMGAFRRAAAGSTHPQEAAE